jgi:hypothetical protein
MMRRQLNRSVLYVRFRGAEAKVMDPRHADRDISDRGMTLPRRLSLLSCGNLPIVQLIVMTGPELGVFCG